MTVSQEQRRTSIVDAAIRILDRDGADALNMRDLADETQLRPMALYHYVSSKAELLSMVIGEVTARVTWRCSAGTPRDRLLTQLGDTYNALAAIPWLPGLLHRGANTGVPPYKMIESFLTTAAEIGLTDEQACDLWRAVWSLIGFELQWHEANRTFARTEAWYESIDPSDVEDDYPLLARVLPQWGTYTGRYDVEAHLAALVDGVIERCVGAAAEGELP